MVCFAPDYQSTLASLISGTTGSEHACRGWQFVDQGAEVQHILLFCEPIRSPAPVKQQGRALPVHLVP